MSVTFTPAQAFAWNGGATATARRPPIITVRRPPGYVEDVEDVGDVGEHVDTARGRERGAWLSAAAEEGAGAPGPPAAPRREDVPSQKVRALLLARLEAAEGAGRLKLPVVMREALLAALFNGADG
jgi:hypothetical protein